MFGLQKVNIAKNRTMVPYVLFYNRFINSTQRYTFMFIN